MIYIVSTLLIGAIITIVYLHGCISELQAELKTSKQEKLNFHFKKQQEEDKLNFLLKKDQEKDTSHQKALSSLTKKIDTLNKELLSSHQENTKLLVYNKDWQKQFNKKQEELLTLKGSLEETEEAKKKITSQKKSGEVRLGNIAEKLAPFLDYFEYDPANAHFLGQPIDYVVFEDDEIVFVEIKTGKSQLSKKQRHIRDLVKARLISWKEIRIQ